MYGTDYENGELTAAIRAIVQDWNDHGIYAGTVRRTRSLTMGNGYIDVDTLGRDNLIYDDSFVKPIDVDYDYEVPFYRISNTAGGYSWDADLIDFATDWTDPSGIKVGDQIIWVTDKDGHVAFVVDLGSRTKAEMGGDAYTAPTWLLNTADFRGTTTILGLTVSDIISAPSSLYAKILKEQRSDLPVMANVNISANVGAGTTLTVALDGAKLGEAKNNTALPGTVTVPVSINSASSAVDLKVTASKAGGGNEALTFVLGSVGGSWSLLSYNGDANNVYTLRLVNSQITAARAISGDIVLFTNEFFEELDELAEAIENNGIGNDAAAGEVTLADAEAVQTLLGDVATILGNTAEYTAKNTDGDATAAVAAKKSEVDNAKTAVDSAVDAATPETTVSVSVTDTNSKITVTPAAVTKDAALSGVTLTLVAADSYTLPTAKPTVTVGGTAVDAANITWDSTTGALGFTAAAGNATGAIVITADSTAPAGDTVSVSVTDTNSKISVTPATVTKDTALSGVTLTLVAADSYTLPTEKPTVTVGGTPVDAANITWDNASGELGFTAAAGNATGAIAITANSTAPVQENVNVTVTDANSKITVTPATVAKGTALSGVTLTLAAADSYTLPTDKPTVTVGGTAVDAANITWDSTTGALGFTAAAGNATGAIVITADSTAPATP